MLVFFACLYGNSGEIADRLFSLLDFFAKRRKRLRTRLRSGPSQAKLTKSTQHTRTHKLFTKTQTLTLNYTYPDLQPPPPANVFVPIKYLFVRARPLPVCHVQQHASKGHSPSARSHRVQGNEVFDHRSAIRSDHPELHSGE